MQNYLRYFYWPEKCWKRQAVATSAEGATIKIQSILRSGGLRMHLLTHIHRKSHNIPEVALLFMYVCIRSSSIFFVYIRAASRSREIAAHILPASSDVLTADGGSVCNKLWWNFSLAEICLFDVGRSSHGEEVLLYRPSWPMHSLLRAIYESLW